MAHIRRILAAALTIALVVGLSAVPARALDGNWDVVPGGEVVLYGNSLQVTNNGATIIIQQPFVEGDLFDDQPIGGVPDPGLDRVGYLNYLTCNGAQGPLGLTLNVEMLSAWKVYADSQSGGIVDIRITDFGLRFSGPGCVWRVTGTLHGTYNNFTDTLTIDEPEDSGSLVISNATCFPFQNGQSPGISGSFQIDPSTTINRRI
ncbi:hypothetical protein [Actinomadura rugatobispora]|uniref:Htaa domain-containing protein n=1 Tax=Actinomadura rugatobispora TaxID=1994 RepID=A0ABW1A274_9ACTN|nr:hypothetical protein GCM10010200_095160 [Actinomadura rugatobispora]